MNILLAVDGSPYTQKMLQYLGDNRDFLLGSHNTYTALTVLLPLPARARVALDKETVLRYYTEESELVMQPVLECLRQHHIEPHVLSQVGNAGDLIAQTAREGGFDLVVMGSHGHSALGNLVMGSVATKVLAQCTVPVLLVR